MRGFLPLLTSVLSILHVVVDGMPIPPCKVAGWQETSINIYTPLAAHSQAPSAIRHVSIINNAAINNNHRRVDHLSHFDLTFNLPDRANQTFKLELEPNYNILASDAHVQYLDAAGNVRKEEPIDRADHRVFMGRALVRDDESGGRRRWSPVGWARIYMKRDGIRPLFEGAFSVRRNDHHIELRSTYMQKKREDDADVLPSSDGDDDDFMVVFRDSDVVQYVHSQTKRSWGDSSICPADSLMAYQNQMMMTNGSWGGSSLLGKRQSDISGGGGNPSGVDLRSVIGDRQGCPSTRKIALVGVATDCEFTGSFDSTQAAREWVINMMNTASSVFERSFNVTLGLRNLTVSDAACPGSAPSTSQWNMPCSQGNVTSRLNLFSKWRSSNADDNAYWTLMSHCATESEVGLSWLGQLCNDGSQTSGGGGGGGGGAEGEGVSGANVVVRTQAGWRVFAHESGHIFGAVHDCESQTCAQGLDRSSQCCPVSSSGCDAQGKYIMNPSASEQASDFSPCTIGNVCAGLSHGVNGKCLTENRNVHLINPSQCGNGIVEDGEDCDCGSEESCGGNNCCDAKTCKFKGGAVCDDSNESCCQNCQFASASTVCRASTGACDVEEKCPGNSSVCPSDVHKPDGSKCGDAKGLTCASGQCTSRDKQCQDGLGSLLHTSGLRACDDSSCSMSCQSPSMPSNQCTSKNTNYLDGTPCGGGGGTCKAGQCQGGSSPAKSWVDNHKPLVIGVVAGIGGALVLGILYTMICRCCCAARSPPRNKAALYPQGEPFPPPPAQYDPYAASSYTSYWPPGNMHPSNSYVPLQPWNPHGDNQYVARPPPPYPPYPPPRYG